ncbi:hypothetical protein ACFV7R_39440 [Streptomyces sp. NPDC059866]|uniref:hypothetical protein n=1 Tax=Streptomyces sp. NPDC059866 TaxID=3346978 RepID=UPI00364BBD5A
MRVRSWLALPPSAVFSDSLPGVTFNCPACSAGWWADTVSETVTSASAVAYRGAVVVTVWRPVFGLYSQ